MFGLINSTTTELNPEYGAARIELQHWCRMVLGHRADRAAVVEILRLVEPKARRLAGRGLTNGEITAALIATGEVCGLSHDEARRAVFDSFCRHGRRAWR